MAFVGNSFVEGDRVRVLQSLGLLDTPRTPTFDRVASLVNALSGAEFSAISLIDADRQWFKACVGLGDATETPRDVAFCAHTILQSEVLWVEDASRDPRFAANPHVTGEPGIRFYAGAPVVVEGRNIGALCVFDRQPRAYDTALAETLERLAGVVSDLCRLHQSESQLTSALDQAGALTAAVEEGREGYASLFRCSGEGLAVIHVSETGVFTLGDVNPAMQDISGLTDDDLGKSVQEAFGPAEARELEARYRSCIESGRPRTWTQSYCVPAGQKTFHVTISPLRDRTGRVSRLLVSGRDLTEALRGQAELRATEEKFERLFRSSADLLIVYDTVDGRDFTFDRVNTVAERVLGRTQDALKGRRIEEVFPPEWSELFVERCRRCASEGVAMGFEDEFTSLAKSYHACLVPLPDADGRTRSVLVSARDTTETRREEGRARESQKLEAIGQLAGGIAHDFNNLLLIIDGFARQASQHIDSPERARDSLGEILQATERANSLIQQLLVFSRRQVRDRQAFAASARVMETERLLRPLLGARYDLKVTVREIASFLHIDTDPSEFSQALMNLAINARDAMPSGGEIAIGLDAVLLDDAFCRASPGLQPGPHLELTVSDTGHGIAPETLKRIFEPFFTTKEQGRGTGLGLAMVYGFAQQSDGAVRVTSVVGAGSTFTLYLPVAKRAPVRLPLPDTDLPRGRGQTVLLVEDDPQVLRLTRDLVEELGYAVLTAADGLEALELDDAHVGSIDVLLTDVVMPGMGGFELAEMLATTRPETCVVYMSGYPTRGDVERVEIPEDAVFLHKPFTPADLAQSLRDAMNRTFAHAPGKAA